MKHLSVATLFLLPAMGWSQSLQIDWQVDAAASSVASVPANATWALMLAVLVVGTMGWMVSRRRGLLAMAVLASMLCMPWGDKQLHAEAQSGKIELTNQPEPNTHTENGLNLWTYQVFNKTGTRIRLTKVELIREDSIYEWADSQPDDLCKPGLVMNPDDICRVNFMSAGSIEQ